MNTIIVSFSVLALLVLPAVGQDKKEEARVANAGTVISEIMNIPDNVPQDTIALAFSGRPLSDTKHCASGFGRALRPRNGKQECTLFQRFDVMHHATVQDQQLSSRQVDLLIRQVDTNLPQQVMNRNSAFRPVLFHLRVGFHQNQNNPEIRILRERPGTPPCLPLPGFFAAELLDFAYQIKLK